MKTTLKFFPAIGLVIAISLLTGCATAPVERSADASAEVEQMSPEALVEDATKLGNYKDLGNRLPFGVRNELPGTSIRVSADVDPYDWLTDSNTGRPSDSQPLGFNGSVIKSGDSIKSWFVPRWKTNSPFELKFFIGNQFGTPPVSMSFDQVYHCFTTFSGQQVPCTNLFTNKSWFGFAWRSSDRNSVDKQYPNICNSTSAEFKYVNESDGTTHTGRGKLVCASNSAAAIGNAIVLEEVK